MSHETDKHVLRSKFASSKTRITASTPINNGYHISSGYKTKISRNIFCFPGDVTVPQRDCSDDYVNSARYKLQEVANVRPPGK